MTIANLSQRQLQGPHTGYHWTGDKRRFFEGWYYRVTLPGFQDGFAFMYSIEDPWGSSPCSGGMAQVLGLGDSHRWQTYSDVGQFWAMRDQLALGHWGEVQNLGDRLPPQMLDPESFFHYVASGYQVTDRLNQGVFADATTGSLVRWCYAVEPVYEYGIPPQATMGALSFLPVFEPGWQILTAYGHASGWVEWNEQRFNFDQVPAYCEKNWGGAFPQKWFWMNASGFEQVPDLCLTAAGGTRELLGWPQDVGMVGLHWQGRFLEWVPGQAEISWVVGPWGSWQIVARQGKYRIEVTGATSEAGTLVFSPTSIGMQQLCRDTTRGRIQLKLWRLAGSVEVLELDTQTQLGALELGGGPWIEPWSVRVNSLV